MTLISLFEKPMEYVDSVKLRQDYENCIRCNLYEKRSQVVFWDGPAKSPLAVFGEAPGADEDRQGVPFCGKAGQRLNQLWAKVGINREKVHLGNTVLCRPTDGFKNLTPVAHQIKKCNNRLMAEINICNPKLIVALGKIATIAILGTKYQSVSMKKLRGMHQWGERSVFVTYHTAYELRMSAMGKFSINKEMFEDWTKIAELIPEVCSNG